MPLPGTRVIPAGWSKHHAPVAAGGMNATVEIRNPADATSTWDDDTESQVTTPGDPVYTGPARIQELNGRDVQQVDQAVGQHTYLLQIPFDAAHVENAWQITVTQCDNDTDLVDWTTDRPLTITDIQHGSERFARDLTATLNLD